MMSFPVNGAKTAVAIPGICQRLHWRQGLGLLALAFFIASCISMAAIYHDPFAHLKLCLGGAAPAPDAGSALLYGHCAWCYLAVGLGLAAVIAPPTAR